ncbi:MAG: transposase [Methanolobus sp.]|nr:transposase [Methanolobus sp.]
MFRYRIYPTKAQIIILADTLELCRWTYNETLALRKNAWEFEQENIGYYESKKMLPGWKVIKPELKNVHSQVLQDVVTRVDLAFQAFFRRCKDGENPGYPRFRGKNRYDSITYTQSGFELQDNKLWLSKIGAIKVKLHRPIVGEIKRITIRRTCTGKWFVSFLVDTDVQKTIPLTGQSVGVDVGIKSFLTLSNGQDIPNPRFFVTEENILAKMVRNHCLAKHIADVSWNKLINITTYKAEWAGKHVELVNPRNTSLICSGCGQIVRKDLSERTHNCPFCSLILDRDHNAAINILRLGLQSVAQKA